MQKVATRSLYAISPGVAMAQKWLASLPEKTGRSLEEWVALVNKSGPASEKERRDWLKREYGLGTNSAWFIAERAEGKGTEHDSPDIYLEVAEKWVQEMYKGGKASLFPVYEALLRLGLSIGKDVKACPCKTMVPFYRNHVFAQIKPSTNTRVDLGLALGNMRVPKRLIDTGGYQKKDRITRRIPISTISEIDGDVKLWLQKAYDLDR
jgi:hypothetical protein